jgi:hypothetical protein
VIGYAPNTSGSPLLIDAATSPSAVDLGVRLDRDLHVDQLRRLAEAPAGAERGQVRRQHVAGELAPDPLLRDVGRPVVEPAQHAEREQVLGLLRVPARDAFEVLDRAHRQRAHRHPLDREAVQRPVLQRVVRVPRLLDGAHAERVLIDEDRGAAAHHAEVRLQRRRVHRDQDIRRVARREDVSRREVDLEGGDTGDGAGGRPDLGREVRQRREIVAEDGGGVGEARAGQLHAVSGVSRHAHDDAFARLSSLHMCVYAVVGGRFQRPGR